MGGCGLDSSGWGHTKAVKSYEHSNKPWELQNILGEEATQYAVLFSFLILPPIHKYLPKHPILKYPQPMFFPKYDQPCFPPTYNRHSIFRNDIPLWYMMINHNHTYISFLLVACIGCCKKQITILQCCIENIMYFLIHLRWFSTKAKICSMQ